MKKLVFFFVIFTHYCFAQSPKTFKTCSKTISYTVNDLMLRKKTGMDLAFPLTNPKFVGGAEELKKYFLANPLKNSGNFRTFIGFVVNCEGQIGNFLIVSEGEGEMITSSEQVLEIVKKCRKNGNQQPQQMANRLIHIKLFNSQL